MTQRTPVNNSTPDSKNANSYISAEGEHIEVSAFTDETVLFESKNGFKHIPYSEIDLTRVMGNKLRKRLAAIQNTLTESAPVT